MKKYLHLALPVLAFAAPASAQEAAIGGFRVEGIVGYDQIDIGLENTTTTPATGAPTFSPFRVQQDTGRIDGAFYGGSVGYDFGFGGFMLGVDAEYTATSADRTFFDLTTITTGATGNAGKQGNNDAELTFKRDLYAGGRATFAATPQTNAYVKLGYSTVRTRLAFESDVPLTIRDQVTFPEDLSGIRAGVGLTYSPEGRAYYGAELRYTNYNHGVDRKQAALVAGYRF
jgi:outer membrane immunogenic protein